ncbi:glycosyltransferase [Staphylotrichum tortipilum]|uniref:UDP-N-acetylglucosamine transferase subunit ALG13 n=1 Tax=Staphylotrichum tortipilum TaxID=2831512 RepID=A0AAN6RS35_9PEZI|nr:glycosyltransferase [Staphylotrichum longicolle]
MVNGASVAASAAPARENKRRRNDSLDDARARAHPTTAIPAPGRRCFVTIGATAGFGSLLEEVSSARFFQALAQHDYTVLEVQCGPDLAAFDSRVARLSDADKYGVAVRSFSYTDEMDEHIVACRGEASARPAGCVISHAGTGTVGEVLGIGAPLIVVANPTLMDNHQLELAETLEEESLVVHGRIGSLATALDRIADRITQGTLDDLPPYSPPPFPVPAADRVTFFDWMVLTCYPAELGAQMKHLSDLAHVDADYAAEQRLMDGVNGHENNGMLQMD